MNGNFWSKPGVAKVARFSPCHHVFNWGASCSRPSMHRDLDARNRQSIRRGVRRPLRLESMARACWRSAAGAAIYRCPAWRAAASCVPTPPCPVASPASARWSGCPVRRRARRAAGSGVSVLFTHVWNRRRLQALFDEVKTVCMHVYGLPVGASKHARSLAHTLSSAYDGSSPQDQPARKSGLRMLLQPVLSSLPKASQTSAGVIPR